MHEAQVSLSNRRLDFAIRLMLTTHRILVHPRWQSEPQTLRDELYTRNAFDSVPDLANSEVKFDEQGDGLARYDILNYQKLPNTSGYHYKVRLFRFLEKGLCRH